MTTATLTATTPGNLPVGAATAITIAGTNLSAVAPTLSAPGCTFTGVSSTTTLISATVTPAAGAAGARLAISVVLNWTVTNKALTSNVATLTTSANHSITVGEVIVVSGVDATFNGTYTVTAVTANTVSYALTAGNVVSVAATGNIAEAAQTVTGPAVVNNGLGGEMYGYYNSYPGGTTGSNGIPSGGTELAVQSATEDTMAGLNPLFDPATETAQNRNQQGSEWSYWGAGVTPAGATSGASLVAGMNTRDVESDLLGVGLGDYVTKVSNVRNVTLKALTSNVATLTLSVAHTFKVGDTVTVAGVDATFNGAVVLTAVTSTTISYAVTAANVTQIAATGTVTEQYQQVPQLLAPSA